LYAGAQYALKKTAPKVIFVGPLMKF